MAVAADDLAQLEQRRLATLRVSRSGGWVVALCLPLFLLPPLVMLWLGADLPRTGDDSTLRAQLQAWVFPNPTPWVIVAFFSPIGGIAWAVWYIRARILQPRNQYLASCKAAVFGAACRTHFPGITYDPAGGIGFHVLDRCGLFPFVSTVYRSEDRFSGTWGSTAVCFAEAVAQREVQRGLPGNRKTDHETYFRGLIFIADFNKHFHSITRLLPTTAESAPKDGETRVQLEDPAFDAVFVTWTTDQLDARYVLSPSLMSRLTALSARYPGMRALFQAERLLLLLPGDRDQFEPSMHVPVHAPESVAQFLTDARQCFDIVEALDLNTRIWSKGASREAVL